MKHQKTRTEEKVKKKIKKNRTNMHIAYSILATRSRRNSWAEKCMMERTNEMKGEKKAKKNVVFASNR